MLAEDNAEKWTDKLNPDCDLTRISVIFYRSLFRGFHSNETMMVDPTL